MLAAIVMIGLVAQSSRAEKVLILQFDCQGDLGRIADNLADSIAANLKILQVPMVERSAWESLLKRQNLREVDLNSDPLKLSSLLPTLGATGAVYGQAYPKNELFVMDCYFVEAGSKTPFEFEPMLGFGIEDLYDLTWNVALIISKPDKTRPEVVAVSPSANASGIEQYSEIKVVFNEPMNPDSYGLAGEPEDLFFAFDKVEYDSQGCSFTFSVHLYPNREYRFWINGPGLKPFMDTTGNVARQYQWSFKTR